MKPIKIRQLQKLSLIIAFMYINLHNYTQDYIKMYIDLMFQIKDIQIIDTLKLVQSKCLITCSDYKTIIKTNVISKKQIYKLIGHFYKTVAVDYNEQDETPIWYLMINQQSYGIVRHRVQLQIKNNPILTALVQIQIITYINGEQTQIIKTLQNYRNTTMKIGYITFTNLINIKIFYQYVDKIQRSLMIIEKQFTNLITRTKIVTLYKLQQYYGLAIIHKLIMQYIHFRSRQGSD
ncbi:hypothetical protein pb186bvf_010477 [Paramecium bursaria]